MTIDLIGRTSELEWLNEGWARAQQGIGVVALVTGEPGIGKSLLIGKFVEHCRARDDSKARQFLTAACSAAIGHNNVLQPIIDLLSDIDGSNERRSQLWRLVGKLLKETAPEWIASVPVVGPIAAASTKTIMVSSALLSSGGGERKDALMLRYVELLTTLAENAEATMLVIEDAHWMDGTSWRLLVKLQERISDKRMLIVVTYREKDLSRDPVIRLAEKKLRNDSQSRRFNLSGLSIEEIGNYLLRRYKSVLSDNLARLLFDVCRGNPLFLNHLCKLLEEEGIIVSTNGQFELTTNGGGSNGFEDLHELFRKTLIPKEVEGLLRERITKLSDDDVRMLEVASVIGRSFRSNVLATISGRRERDVLAQLRKIAEEQGIVTLVSNEDGDSTNWETYEFEHVLMQNAFYQKLTPREARIYHKDIAKLLSERETVDRSKRRETLLISYHFQKAGKWSYAAKYALDAAKTMFEDGSLAECAHHCENILNMLNRLEKNSVERNNIFIECVQLLITCSWPKSRKETVKIVALAEQAAGLANQLGNQVIYSALACRAGSLYIGLGDMARALDRFEKAVEAARASNDKLALSCALEVYGRDLSKIDLKKGMQLRREAHSIFESLPDAPQESAQARQFYRSKMLVSLGVGELDVGNFSEAIKNLTKGIEIIKQLNIQHAADIIAPPTNYLAQVYLSIGYYEVAEALLRGVIDFDQEDYDPWNGNNLGLLGKLYLEMGKKDQAAEILSVAISESESAQQADLITLVRNYCAELYICEHSSHYSQEKARSLLEANILECRKYQLYRSEVVSLALLSRLCRSEGLFDEALMHAAAAIDLVNKYGALPAVRLEEIHFNYYEALLDVGDLASASREIQKAYEILMRKASSLSDRSHRLSFLGRVEMSRIILAHAASIQSDSCLGKEDEQSPTST